jgi:hypothetical protein
MDAWRNFDAVGFFSPDEPDGAGKGIEIAGTRLGHRKGGSWCPASVRDVAVASGPIKPSEIYFDDARR